MGGRRLLWIGLHSVVCGGLVGPAGDVALSEDELRDFVRDRLRSTKTPERIEIRDELPYNETGKLLRRVLREELASTFR